jgi:hypothetical protein
MQVTRALAVIAAVISSSSALAQPAVEDACLADHRRTQELQLENKLIEADAAAVACAQPKCPAEVRTMCADFISRIRASQPTVVFEIRGTSGKVYASGTVTIDGAAGRSLDGSAIAVDPGKHTIEFETGGLPKGKTTILVNQGEKDKKVSLEVADAGGSPTFSPAAHVLGAFGLASLTAFGVLGIVTTLQADELEDDCGKRCTDERPDDVDAVTRQAIAADVCLAGGLTLLVAAGLTMGLTWTVGTSSEATASIRAAPGGAFLDVTF